MTTATPTGTTSARDDARSQGEGVSDWMPYLPASATPYPPEGVDAASLTWAASSPSGTFSGQAGRNGATIASRSPTR